MDHISQAFDEAVALHEAGRLAEAEQAYHAILNVQPDHVGSLHHLGVLRGQQGRFDEAIGLLRRALARDPTSAEAHNHAGWVLHSMQRHEAAIASFDEAIALDHGYVEAHYNRGTALQALRRHDAAIASYETALKIEPDIPAVRYNLGSALQTLGRHEAAIAQYEQALATDPDYLRARTALGMALQTLGRHDAAIAHYERALAADPGLADVHDRLGSALQLVGRHDAAIACYEKALALDPDNADTHNNLGLALHAANRPVQAIGHYERALAIRPGFASAHNNLGLALQALDRHEEAIAQYRAAIAAGPPHARRHANMGVALQEIGRLDEAARAFEKAIALAPRNGRFYRHLADCKRFTVGDPALTALRSLAAGRASLPEEDRRQLLFALAKGSADLGDHERSFGYLLEGNALKRKQVDYDEARVLGEFTRIRTVFSRELMTARGGVGHPSAVPVFIVGMPRSGTTLIEQILASHPQVFGAGELTDIGDAAARMNGLNGAAGAFPEIAVSLPDEVLRQFGARYVNAARARAPTAERVTDKMPLNFFFVGLIHLALPNARIIHARRDPLDTCLSCFATLFTGDHRVAYELGELGRYYRAYEGLMEHWARVLPDGVLLEVRYEDVVADLGRQARRIVAHCGLGWDDACLGFHGSRRPVRTASATQVRRPVYHSSVGRWRDYGELLNPLMEALGVDVPSTPIRER
jgi:tetratricopeptide (TPR) repeat protein